MGDLAVGEALSVAIGEVKQGKMVDVCYEYKPRVPKYLEGRRGDDVVRVGTKSSFHPELVHKHPTHLAI